MRPHVAALSSRRYEMKTWLILSPPRTLRCRNLPCSLFSVAHYTGGYVCLLALAYAGCVHLSIVSVRGNALPTLARHLCAGRRYAMLGATANRPRHHAHMGGEAARRERTMTIWSQTGCSGADLSATLSAVPGRSKRSCV